LILHDLVVLSQTKACPGASDTPTERDKTRGQV
jgi:hypothetical protein